MIRLLGKIPDDVIVACSGGSDSMAVLDFLNNGRRKVSVAYFNHGTEHGRDAEKFLVKYCKDNNLKFYVDRIQRDRLPRESLEEYWRNERYRFFQTLYQRLNKLIVTGHHLDDAVEWWVYTSLHGIPRLTPYENSNIGIIRPFLLTSKQKMLDWVNRKRIPYVEDPSNSSTKHARNIVRHKIIPSCLEVQPGLSTVILKKLKESVKHYEYRK